jgi:hypothetical protein
MRSRFARVGFRVGFVILGRGESFGSGRGTEREMDVEMIGMESQE